MKRSISIPDALALAFYFPLIVGLSVTFPFVSIMGGTYTSGFYISAIVGLAANWILLAIFIKKGWSKILLLLLLYPVLIIARRIVEADFPGLIIDLFFTIGLTIIVVPRDYCRFISKKYKKKFVPSTIRIIGGIILIISIIIVLLR